MKLDGTALWDFLNRLLDRLEVALGCHRDRELPPAPLVGRRRETPRQQLRRRLGLDRR